MLELSDCVGVGRHVGDVAKLPGIGSQIVELEPGTGSLEEPLLRRGEPPGPGTAAALKPRIVMLAKVSPRATGQETDYNPS